MYVCKCVYAYVCLCVCAHIYLLNLLLSFITGHKQTSVLISAKINWRIFDFCSLIAHNKISYRAYISIRQYRLTNLYTFVEEQFAKLLLATLS